MQVGDIIAKAQQATGLSDVGDRGSIDNLERLVKATNDEARLSPQGARQWENMLVEMLSNRLRIVDYLKNNPSLLERPVDRPTFVFGLPRTGTTLTINLLNADPMRRCLLRWEALNSVPPAARGALHSDPRCIAEQKKTDMAVEYMPHIAAIHHEDADSPSECQYPMAHSFCGQIFESMVNIPSYGDWLHETDCLPAFRFHKQMLQLLQAENGGHWTLKNPWHPLFLDDLTTVYPDAQLVMTHRDPVEVVGSACSLVRHVRPLFSDEVDLREIAEQTIGIFDLMIARQKAYREKNGFSSIHDIRYVDQMRDPIGTMRKMYRHFGEELSADAETAMVAMLAANPQGKHGKHSYSLEEFGLVEADIRERYRDYCDEFGIEPASASH